MNKYLLYFFVIFSSSLFAGGAMKDIAMPDKRPVFSSVLSDLSVNVQNPQGREDAMGDIDANRFPIAAIPTAPVARPAFVGADKMDTHSRRFGRAKKFAP